jgi:nucleotide-binding universal stress UspA family protein
MFDKILVAIDGSEFSRTIFDRALALAKADRSELMLLHVLTLLENFYPGEAYLAISESALRSYATKLENREQAETQKLQSLATEAIAAGIPTEFTQQVGDPGKSICAVAKTWNANLIVIGRRGFSGLNELLLGSTSNYVLHHAPCDVLTIQQGTTQTLPQLEIAATAAGTI